jgi:hypothetical protein
MKGIAFLNCKYISSATLSNQLGIRDRINFLPSCTMFRYTLILSGALLLFTFSPSTLAQLDTETGPLAEDGSEATPTGSVENSKYLSITDHRYRNGDFSDQITGTVVNNSTQEVSQVTVTAALYDSSDKLITTEWGGFADVSTLPSGDNSAFSITLSSVEEKVDHYTLFPGGMP